MSDIVERLREKRGVLDNRWPGPTLMDEEAAREIEKLRKQVEIALEALRCIRDISASVEKGKQSPQKE